MKKYLWFFLIAPCLLSAQQPAVEASRKWIEKNGVQILEEFTELLVMPNHASDLVNIRKNANKLQEMFGQRGFNMQLLELPDAPPIVYGERKVPGATRTLCFYVHYDGQPVDPSAWTHAPFDPIFYDHSMEKGGKPIPAPQKGEAIHEDWRIYARSTSDDKAPAIALMAAIDALEEAGIGYTSNIKLFFDGEEESGSPNLVQYFEKYGELFEDITAWLICDGAVFQTGAPQFKFGGRGVTGMELTVYGAVRPLHSGHYGNWAPVPGQMLARLLTSMKAEDGTVLIDGFYNTVEPISEFERSMLDQIPNIDEQLKHELGLAKTEGNGTPLYERLLNPSLTIKGLSSGNVGDKARNIIPNKAVASIGMRLVKGNDPDHMQDLVEAHIRKQGWHIVYEEPGMDVRRKYAKVIKVERGLGSKAGKTRMDQPDIKNIIEEVRKFTGEEVVFLPSSGGSNRAYYVIFEILKKPGISVNMVNHDNNQHAADENIRIGNLWYGIELMSVLLTLPE